MKRRWRLPEIQEAWKLQPGDCVALRIDEGQLEYLADLPETLKRGWPGVHVLVFVGDGYDLQAFTPPEEEATQ